MQESNSSTFRSNQGETRAPVMEGFGNTSFQTPFHYGSVEDGRNPNPSLEQKLKKKYWKTKQSMIQKLGKTQDEFVIAGDSDIDTKLENAYHLRSSCQELLQVLEKYSYRLRALSSHELSMGEFLTAYSENEYTNAGEVMKNVGKIEERDAKARMSIIPALLRMQHEFSIFVGSAIWDLDHSIQILEKARTEYRAALLWMKNVSDKLHDPDYRDQLARFREAQLAVKESKRHFEKLKNDLGEKIEMVSASRCNLLSRSLPSYQKVVLDFLDRSANEFHQVLAELRSQHHHQYKVRKILEEIRDLEAEESIEGDPSLALTPEGDVDAPSQEETKTTDDDGDDDDEPLIDIGEEVGEDATTMEGDEMTREENGEEVKMKDQPLTALESDLQELESQQQQSSAVDELNDLLGLGPQEQPSTNEGQAEGDTRKDELCDEWSDFSAFMSATKSDNATESSEWEKEFMQSDDTQDMLLDENGSVPSNSGPFDDQLPPPSSETEDQLTAKDSLQQPPSSQKSDQQPPSLTTDEILGLLQPPAGSNSSSATALADEILSLTLDPAGENQQTPTKDKPSTAGLESLDPAFFHQATPLPPLSAPLPLMMAPSLSQPPPPQPQMMSYPIRGPLPLYYSPMVPPNQVPHTQPMPWGTFSAIPGAPPSGQQPKAKQESSKPTACKKDKKGSSWMNVFAHLDPLSNEKA